jgi:hypothetical protein
MKPSISLTTYAITARDYNDPSKLFKFDSIIGNKKIKELLFSLFLEYEDKQNEDSITRIENPVIRPRETFNCSLESISGFFYHGTYGYKTILKDTREVNVKLDLIRESYHAEEIPFYFSLTLSEKSTKAIVCLQKFSQHGIKSVLDAIIARHNRENEDIIFTLRPIVSGMLAKVALENAVVNRIEIVKYVTPEDRFDSFRTERYQIDHVAKGLELTKGNMPALFNKMIALLTQAEEMTPRDFFDKDLLELVSHDGKDIDNTKVTVNINGKDRIFNFSRSGLFNLSYDITESVSYSDTRFPTFESLEVACDTYVDENFSQIIQGQTNEI